MNTKTCCFALVFAILSLAGCKTNQPKQSSTQVTGTYKVAILYQDGEGKTFDMDYYVKKHMPMVAGILGTNLNFYEIDKGIGGRTANDKATYVAIGYFYIKDVAAYNKAIADNRDAVINDIKNYTNIQPVIQVNEIKYSGGVR